MDNKTRIRIAALEAAVKTAYLFPLVQVHELARKYEYYIINDEWPANEYGLDSNRIGQERISEDSNQESTG